MFFLWNYYFPIVLSGYAKTFFACFLFSRKLSKRKYYWRRLAVGLVVSIGLLILYSYIEWLVFPNIADATNIPMVIIQQFIILSFNYLLLMLVSDSKISALLLCFLSAVATASATDDAYAILSRFGIVKFSYFAGGPGVAVFNWLIFYAIHFVMIFGIYCMFGRRNSENIAENKMLLWSLFIILFICLMVNAVTSTYEFGSNIIAVTYRVLSIICVVFILLMREEVQKYSKAKSDLIIADQIVKQQARQYEQAAKNIELVNIKCHDLRRQISSMSDQNQVDVKEIAKIVRIYDSGLKTGNETLDVILIGKSLYCEANNITLTCMIDGNKLSAISISDLHALFGNLLDNAVEYVSKISDHEKRFIRVLSKEENRYFILTVENYFEGDILFDEQGIPITTKNDKGIHGFGTRSIKRIAERYGGFADMQVDCGLYIARVFFPLNEVT